jgi:hypothetical protein
VDVHFRLPERIEVPTGEMTRLDLRPDQTDEAFSVDDGVITIAERGWYEVHLTVAWDPSATAGTRFTHTKIPEGHPLHSEAIDAAVLGQISDGRQLLRGNAIFGDGETDQLALEVWHDAPQPVGISEASLRIRRLPG